MRTLGHGQVLKLFCCAVLLLLALVLGGCMAADSDVKNMPGNAGVTISTGSNDVHISTLQPENPNQSAVQEIVFFEDGSLQRISQQTGGAFENKLGKLKGIFSLSRIYIIASVLCAVAGAVILSLSNRYSNKLGWSLIGLGACMGAFGAILPDMGTYIALIALFGAVGGTGYMILKKRANAELESAGTVTLKT